MIGVLADNIYSPLGRTSEQNYRAAKSGATGLRHVDAFGLEQPVTASLFPDGQVDADFAAISVAEGLTKFEKMLAISIADALSRCQVDAASPRTLIVISSTKGNVDMIDRPGFDSSLAASAEKVARHFGNPNTPIVVSNACISGVNALIVALRLLQTGRYDHAIVSGADSQSRFIVSGFLSFKALSPEECRPFDADRIGLNLGEAAATIIYSARPSAEGWNLAAGAVRNDANHISGPSRTGEGCYRALQTIMQGVDPEEIALVNAHGTATPYNDEMESIALDRAGLASRPVNALKGYFGHTMGAAGILETIMSMRSLSDHTILGTRGFGAPGTSRAVNVDAANRPASGRAFIKMLSGFGGCNAAILMRHGAAPVPVVPSACVRAAHNVRITPDGAWVDGEQLPTSAKGAELVTELYRAHVKDYPKYFKMDPLSRLGFVAAELLLRRCAPAEADDARAIILTNRTASLCNDRRYQSTISKADYFPSPALFVYTLPNIVTGEISIRNKYYGETTFYILPSADEAQIKGLVDASMQDPATRSAIAGWLECPSADEFLAELTLYEKQ